jgi:DNA-binding winged helix-turn-helix (wHTH) protein
VLVDSERLVFGDFRLETGSGRLFHRDAAGSWVLVPIGSRAVEILRVLISHPGEVVSKDAIEMAALRRVLDEGRSGEAAFRRCLAGVTDLSFL